MILRLQVSAMADTALARDRMVITPHFSTNVGPPDADALCEDLALALWDWMNDKRQVEVTAYDAQGAKPVYPIGNFVTGGSTSPPSTCPREVALCLSFFSGRNIPSYRGRLYIPHTWNGGDSLVRPAAGAMSHVAGLAAIFADLGGPDIDWCVYSRKQNAAHSVSDWWVDNEWDTIRSRGLRADSRLTGTVSE